MRAMTEKENAMRSRASSGNRERGSALLVSLMVMVGLSLLGLGYVAVSSTESAISVNERNYAQTLAVAEAGAKVVVQWFQDPEEMLERGLLPENTDDIKTQRVVGAYAGMYKAEADEILFDKPFKPESNDRFYGNGNLDIDNADIIINEETAADFLTTFNDALFPADFEGGRVTDIRIYAPPIVNATDDDPFFVGGVRYGLATIRVTAQKRALDPDPADDEPGQLLAERTVKLVVSEWPFPGPQGPIQSNANIDTGGNLRVHWGKVTAQESLSLASAKIAIGMPWFDAWERIHFERGYAADWAKSGASFPDGEDWFYEMLERNIEDPWLEMRSRGPIEELDPDTTPHPYKYDVKTEDILATPNAGHSSWFQFQDNSAKDGFPDDYREVVFPRIDYTFWKEVAQQGAGQEGVYYLWPTADAAGCNANCYTNGAATKSFRDWVSVPEGGEAGFFFFDTQNQLNPQGQGAPGELAEDVKLSGGSFQMMGFVYLNVGVFGTTGLAGPEYLLPAPGEPFRDIGYPEVDAAGAVINAAKDAGNNRWDYQDLNDNGEFDLFVDQRAGIVRPSGGAAFDAIAPVAYTAGCNVGVNCSEPHEPYLNILYPATPRTGGTGTGPSPMRFEWEAQGADTQEPTDTDENGDPVDCAADPDNCTSNKYNRNGRLMTFEPVMVGVFYNEGQFDSSGNADYLGSVLINGDVLGNGNAEVWFDERLIKGEWPPDDIPIPRVYVTAHQTDQ